MRDPSSVSISTFLPSINPAKKATFNGLVAESRQTRPHTEDHEILIVIISPLTPRTNAFSATYRDYHKLQRTAATSVMIEDEIYRSSTQFRLWSFTQDSLASLRSSTNALASDRVRAALRRARQTRQSATPSTAGTPTPSDAETKPEGGPEKEIECLTPQEELELVVYYCEKTLELGETYKPPLPTIVRVR